MKEARKLQNIFWILEVNISSRIPLTLVAAKHYFSINSNSHITNKMKKKLQNSNTHVPYPIGSSQN
jgi:hypothetical protein